MKTKILMFPLLLLIMLVAIIWFVVPAWKNVKAQREVLSSKEALLGRMQSKNQIAGNLKSELDKMTTDKELIYSYVPKESNDEEILNSFIGYANLQGDGKSLRMYSFSVGRTKNEGIKSIATSSGKAGEKTETIVPVSLTVKIGASARYEGFKEFFAKISTLKRALDFSMVEIKKEGDSEFLLANAEFSFNYLNQYNPGEIDESLLAETFDKKTLQMVRDKENTDVMKVDASAQGRINPFMP